MAKSAKVPESVNGMTVLGPTGRRNRNRSMLWRCRCHCGRECDVPAYRLIYKRAKSCGCRATQKGCVLSRRDALVTNDVFFRARQAAGLTMPEIARRLKVTPGLVAHWQSCRSRPRPEHEAALREMLGVGPGVVLFGGILRYKQREDFYNPDGDILPVFTDQPRPVRLRIKSLLSRAAIQAAREPAEDVAEALRLIMGPLTTRQRDVLLGRYVQGLTGDEVGRRLGVSGTRAWQIEDKAMRRCRVAAGILFPGGIGEAVA